jgi:transcriptional regulator with XRE-family HTH domain
MAKKLAVHPSTLRNYEYDKVSPDKAFFTSLQKTYGIDLTRFYDPAKTARYRKTIHLDKLEPGLRDKIIALLEGGEVPAPAKINVTVKSPPPDVPDVDGIDIMDSDGEDDLDDLDEELEGIDLRV